MRVLLISGSPRKGNTEFILNKVFDGINSDEKELILLREKEIKHCQGCLYCDEHKRCSINDDMQEIYEKLKLADIIILGTPNYYDNVSGLFKDFMDRTNPFYQTGILKGKKLINIIVGGGSINNSKRVIDTSLNYFGSAHEFDIVDSFCFKGLGIGEVQDDSDFEEKLNQIIDKINSLNV